DNAPVDNDARDETSVTALSRWTAGIVRPPAAQQHGRDGTLIVTAKRAATGTAEESDPTTLPETLVA
ncbi:hypothetical protein J6590_060510, partial [Homalodisca vitripennis]